MGAYAKQGDPLGATDVLDRMKDARVQPNIISYNSLITAWARSNNPERVQRGESVWHQLKSAGLKPRAQDFNVLLSLYKDAPDKVNIVRAVLRSMEEAGVQRSSATDRTLEKICGRGFEGTQRSGRNTSPPRRDLRETTVKRSDGMWPRNGKR
jgi:pentatricopeptide repeat protein